MLKNPIPEMPEMEEHLFNEIEINCNINHAFINFNQDLKFKEIKLSSVNSSRIDFLTFKQNLLTTKLNLDGNIRIFDENNICILIEKHIDNRLSLSNKENTNLSFISSKNSYNIIIFTDTPTICFGNSEIKEEINIDNLSCNNTELFKIENCKVKNLVIGKVINYVLPNTIIENATINSKEYNVYVKFKNIKDIRPIQFIQENEDFVCKAGEKNEEIEYFSIKGIKKITVSFLNKKRFIYLDKLFKNFANQQYTIKINNVKENDIVYLPLKENSLKLFLPYLEDINLNDLYSKKDELFLELKEEREYLSSLGYIESELRLNKHIILENKYAILCEKSSFKDGNFLDKIWGCKWLYNFGYTENPLQKFGWLYLFQLLLIVIIFLIDYYVNNNIKFSDFFNFVFDASIPLFKLNSNFKFFSLI